MIKTSIMLINVTKKLTDNLRAGVHSCIVEVEMIEANQQLSRVKGQVASPAQSSCMLVSAQTSARKS